MLSFLGRRLLQLIPTLFFVSVLIFSLQQLLPGDPALVMAGEERDPEIIARIRAEYRFDQPLPVQYIYWMKGVLTGNLGESLRIKVPVLELSKHGDHHLAADRHSRRHHLRGEEGNDVGLRRQCVRAVGHLHAELLARHHADLRLLDPARMAASVGLCQPA
jgi:hypothetical protein